MQNAFISLLTVAAIVAPACGAEWLTDLETAKKQAAAENKAILVDFTGSDWCGYCIRLKKNIFDKPEFADYAKDKFVLLEVDVPRNPQFDRALLARNRELCKRYKVGGYPTIMVLTSEGEVAGGFVGGLTDMSEVQAILNRGYDNAKALTAAQQLSGDERLKALFNCYVAIPSVLRDSSNLLAVVEKEDVNGVSGLREMRAAEEQMDDFRRRVAEAGNDRQKVLELVCRLADEALAPNKPTMVELKFSLQLASAKTYDDLEAARKTLLELAELCPERAPEIQEFIETEYRDRDAMLRKIAEMNGEN